MRAVFRTTRKEYRHRISMVLLRIFAPVKVSDLYFQQEFLQVQYQYHFIWILPVQGYLWRKLLQTYQRFILEIHLLLVLLDRFLYEAVLFALIFVFSKS